MSDSTNNCPIGVGTNCPTIDPDTMARSRHDPPTILGQSKPVHVAGKIKTAPIYDNDNKKLSSIKYFESMVDLAYKNDIKLYIYFSPIHARLTEVNCMIGRWSHIETMKRAVVRIVNKKALDYGRAPYQVWDFSGYNSITTEAVPEKMDKTGVMSWYWEGSHYTRETSRLIFDKIFNCRIIKLYCAS